MIGGTITELQGEGVLGAALGYQLPGTLIACYGRRMHRHYGIGIAQENCIAAMDLEIRYLLPMAYFVMPIFISLSSFLGEGYEASAQDQLLVSNRIGRPCMSRRSHYLEMGCRLMAESGSCKVFGTR